MAAEVTHSPMAPGWSKPATLALGRFVASQILANPSFGDSYLAIVKRAKADGGEYITEYRTLLQAQVVNEGSASLNSLLSESVFERFNSNDFANVHHTAWLVIVGALAHLTNLNPHADWGEPPPHSSVHPAVDDRVAAQPVHLRTAVPSNEFFMHYVPNATGCYAVGTSDVNGAPNLGV